MLMAVKTLATKKILARAPFVIRQKQPTPIPCPEPMQDSCLKWMRSNLTSTPVARLAQR